MNRERERVGRAIWLRVGVVGVLLGLALVSTGWPLTFPWRLGVGAGLMGLAALAVWLPLGGHRLSPRLVRRLEFRDRAIVQGVLPLGALAAMAIATAGSVAGTVGPFGGAMLGGAGVLLVQLGWRQRMGQEPVCAKCEYPLVMAATPEHCPECGHGWLAPGGVVHGHTRWRGLLLAAGLGLMLVPVLGTVSVLGSTGLRRHVPTGLLIQQAQVVDGLDSEVAWRELGARKLGAAVTQRLAKIRLGQWRTEQVREQAWPGDTWMEAQLTAGTLSPELAAEVYSAMYRPRLVAPERVHIGERVFVSLAAERRGSPQGAFQAFATFEGFLVDGSRPAERAGRVRATFTDGELEQQAAKLPTPDSAVGALPHVMLSPRSPGKLLVQARVWVFICPRSSKGLTVVWDESGEPMIPDAAVHARRVDLEAQITVER